MNNILFERKQTMLAYVIIASMIIAAMTPVFTAQAATNDGPEYKGFVESMPAGGRIGTWVIGGQTFIANASTEFENEHGSLAVGSCAEVEYRATASGNIAHEIESEHSGECDGTYVDDDDDDFDDDDSFDDSDSDGREGDDDDDDGYDDDGYDDDRDGNEVYGILQSMPATGNFANGTWVVNGVSYVSTASSEIEAEHGPFTVGGRVEVEYTVVNGVNQILEIETEPLPGDGANTKVDFINSQSIPVVSASTSASNVWIIGNKEYTIVSITELNEARGSLAVGSLVEVNSYTEADGREIATRIQSVDMPAQTEFIFLPVVSQG